MDLVKLLRTVEMFTGLTDDQFAKLAAIFDELTLGENEVLFEEGQEGDSLCLIQKGFVEIVVGGGQSAKTIVNLGAGQLVGEMALVDQGPRSATVRSADDGTQVAVVTRKAFEDLCKANTDIGYVVMRNIAADLSFKLRHRELSS